MKTIVKSVIFVLALSLILFGVANASLISYSSRASFNSQGTIVYNYDFEDLPAQPFYFPGDPWTTHGVKYSTANNLIVEPTSGYGNSSNVFVNNYWTPLPATMVPSLTYNMFGLDLGALGADSLMDFEIITNLNTYEFNDLTVPNVRQGMSFFGFIAGPGEYFNGFTLSSEYGGGSAPAIDNVALGNTAIPEPATMLLLGSGLIGLAGYGRKKFFKK